MKQYTVTVTSSLIDEERIVTINAKDPQDAHKETMFSEGFDMSYDKIQEIRNDEGVLVYGQSGFVNALRDLHA